ncbi:MAG TPA: hypothetical protein VIN58_23735 [Roseateles sp.]
MWIALGWVLVLLLLAGWSALVWTGSALLTALLAHAGTLGAGDWSLPEPLTNALPTWAAEWLAATLENWTPQLQSLAGLLPSLSGGVTVLAWSVWGRRRRRAADRGAGRACGDRAMPQIRAIHRACPAGGTVTNGEGRRVF